MSLRMLPPLQFKFPPPPLGELHVQCMKLCSKALKDSLLYSWTEIQASMLGKHVYIMCGESALILHDDGLQCIDYFQEIKARQNA